MLDIHVNCLTIILVFLRILEYYNGILFLTTNQVGSFDEAFKSRIHMSLYYPPLKRKQTVAIWEMNLDRAVTIDAQEVKVTKRPPMVIHRTELVEYAGKHFDETEQGSGRWNGRQIRNAFQIATALAHFTAEEENKKPANKNRNQQADHPLPMAAPILNVELFETVAAATLHFDKYLTETAGFTDTELALEQGDRADHHNFRWTRSVVARNLGKPSSQYHSPDPKYQDHSPYGIPARNTGNDRYRGEEAREPSYYRQAQSFGAPQAYPYPHGGMGDRRLGHSSGNFPPPQEDYYPDELNEGTVQNPGVSHPATGQYFDNQHNPPPQQRGPPRDNQYNPSPQQRPTPPRADHSAQFQTPTRGKTAGLAKPPGNSAGQYSRTHAADQDSEYSD